MWIRPSASPSIFRRRPSARSRRTRPRSPSTTSRSTRVSSRRPAEPTTMSIAIVASRLATGPTDHPEGGPGAIPRAGMDAFSQSRRDRLRGEHSAAARAGRHADRRPSAGGQPQDAPGPGGPLAPLRLRRQLPHGEPGRLRQGAGAQGARPPHPEAVRGRRPVRARPHPQGRGRQDHRHHAARHGARRSPARTASSRSTRTPTAGPSSERVTKQTRATVRDVVHKAAEHQRASPTSRLSSRATRPASTSSRRTPTRCCRRRSTRTTTTWSPT